MNKVTASAQQWRDLKVEKEVESDGIGMGVLSDGTLYLTGRGQHIASPDTCSANLAIAFFAWARLITGMPHRSANAMA